MKAFNGLLKKERFDYLGTGFGLLGIVLILIWLAPIAIHRYFDSTSIHHNRYVLVVVCFILIIMVGLLYQFMGSLNRDISRRELWLHNQQSIVKLVFAKAVYQGIQTILLCSVSFIGFFFVGEEVVGSMKQMLVFYMFSMYIVLAAYVSFSLMLLCFFALNIQLNRYIGKLSGFITFIGGVAFITLSGDTPSHFLPYWKISTEPIIANLPQFNNETILIAQELYLVEGFAYLLFFIFLFVLACKWIERVITR